MMIRRSIQYMLLLILVAGIVYALARSSAASHERAVPGHAAPQFTLIDLHGEEVQLADYKGKGILLNFWASWCNPCVNELPLLNEAYKLTGVEMLAINIGERDATVQKFVDRYELAFPVMLDTEMTTKQQYRAASMPLTVLINAEGDIIERHEGELTEMSDILNLMARIKEQQ